MKTALIESHMLSPLKHVVCEAGGDFEAPRGYDNTSDSLSLVHFMVPAVRVNEAFRADSQDWVSGSQRPGVLCGQQLHTHVVVAKTAKGNSSLHLQSCWRGKRCKMQLARFFGQVQPFNRNSNKS